MKVKVNIVGQVDPEPVEWPEGWPIPREGETVETANGPLSVRTVVWYPVGDPHDPESPWPFVYLVLGLERRF